MGPDRTANAELSPVDVADATGPSLALIAAFTSTWASIQARHPEVPPAVVMPAPGAPRRELAHFGPHRWRVGSRNEHEVLVGAEAMAILGPAGIVESLLHEAAHALNHVRGRKDCSRSQYHNDHYRQAALEVGLRVVQAANYGWASTSLPDETAELYRGDIARFERLRPYRLGTRPRRRDAGGVRDGAGGRRAGAAIAEDAADAGAEALSESRVRRSVCACPRPRIIRLSRATFDAGGIRCERCGELFVLSDG